MEIEPVDMFYNAAERVKYEHIDQQVHPIRMQKSITEKAVPLFAMMNIKGIEF